MSPEEYHKLPFRNPLTKTNPRMLYIVPWLGVGGSDKFNLDAVRLLAKRGWEITIATTLEGDHSWMPLFAEITPDIFPLRNFLRADDCPRFIRYLIESRNPDAVVISHSELGYMMLPYLRNFCPKPVYLDVCHIEEPKWVDGGYPRYAINNQTYFDLNIVTTKHLKDWMVERGGDGTKIEVAYTNIDCEARKPDPAVRQQIRAENSISPKKTVLLYACRLVAQKQPKVFMGVMNELKKQDLDFLAVVVGEGDERPWMEQFSKENDLSSRVAFIGELPNDLLHQMMQASDIFFLPSENEGISVAVYEAMATGLAVVAAAVGGQPELVIPGTGMLVERGTPEVEVIKYTEILSDLIRNKQKQQEFKIAARKRVRTFFELEHLGDRLVSLFRRAIQLRKQSIRDAGITSSREDQRRDFTSPL